jgi:integrase
MALTVMAGGRERKLFREKAGGNFLVRFKVRGKEMLRSTGTTIEAAAKQKARQIVEAEINGDFEKSRALKMRSDYSGLEEVARIYLENYGTTRDRAATARSNVYKLAKMLRVVLGLRLDYNRKEKRWTSNAHANALTAELIEKYQAKAHKRIKRDKAGFVDRESQYSVLTSTVSEVTHARAVFKRSTRAWYKQLALPDLTGFLNAPMERPKEMLPKRLEQHVIDAINEAAPQLAKENPPLRIVHLLFSRAGMRNKEIALARRGWITKTPELAAKGIAARLSVIPRPEEDFEPKGKPRHIPMDPATLAEIEKLWTRSADGDFLVPAEHKTARYDLIYHEHRAWLAQLGVKDYRKVSYELRRLAGSLLYRHTRDIRAVQRFLGHASLTTTEKHYQYDLDETPPIPTTEFAAPAPDNVVTFAQQ